MGWSIGYDSNWKRDIGYGVPAVCDFPKCNTNIDRGLSYVCGGEPYGGEKGCGLYFCEAHLSYAREVQLCSRCTNYRLAFKPKADTKRWTDFKATDPSWEEWRKEEAMKKKQKRLTEEELVKEQIRLNREEQKKKK